jgi:hypothetical protein
MVFALLLSAFLGFANGDAAPASPHRTISHRRVFADTSAASRDSMMNAMLESIKGKERMPAESVFKNIRTLKGVFAGGLLRIMNLGYGRSLGVGCAHCHVVGEWDKEDKPQKQIARDMAAMSAAINTQLLPAIKNLKSDKPVVNCTTCHRGDVKPALNLPAAP